MIPPGSYGAMSDEEHRTLRHHRAEIVNIVREHYGGLARATTSEPGTAGTPPPVAEPPPPCPHCYQSPCIGEQHELFALLHPLTERQAFEQRMAQSEKDLHEMEMRRRFGLPSPTWDL